MLTEEATDLLIQYLKEKCPDIIIHYYHSYTSNSIYLKLDYGAANSIRISDHDKSDNGYNYKYELRTDKELSWHRFENGIYKIMYPATQIEQLANKIIKERDKKIKAIGQAYINEMDKKKRYMNSDRSKKFYKMCKEIDTDNAVITSIEGL